MGRREERRVFCWFVLLCCCVVFCWLFWVVFVVLFCVASCCCCCCCPASWPWWHGAFFGGVRFFWVTKKVSYYMKTHYKLWGVFWVVVEKAGTNRREALIHSYLYTFTYICICCWGGRSSVSQRSWCAVGSVWGLTQHNNNKLLSGTILSHNPLFFGGGFWPLCAVVQFSGWLPPVWWSGQKRGHKERRYWEILLGCWDAGTQSSFVVYTPHHTRQNRQRNNTTTSPKLII